MVNIHVLKVKFTITKYNKCFAPEISTSQNLFKEDERMNSDTPGRSTNLE